MERGDQIAMMEVTGAIVKQPDVQFSILGIASLVFLLISQA